MAVPVSAQLSVQVADGSRLSCVVHIPGAQWFTHNLCFVSDLKILSISSYDMILGLDWLEQFSPMKVHWVRNGCSFLIMVLLNLSRGLLLLFLSRLLCLFAWLNRRICLLLILLFLIKYNN